jgi:hypothetical protein
MDAVAPTADNPAGSLLERATRVRADAVHHLTLLAGDASMCVFGRSGRSFPAAKYHEGRQAAAGQVLRALQRHRAVEEQALATLGDQWREMLASAQAKGRDWVAYASGGLDALTELAAGRPATAPRY